MIKNILNKLTLPLCAVLAFFLPSAAQDSFQDTPSFEVNRIYPSISVSKEKLNAAHTLSDLADEHNNLTHCYKSSWIREYISVEILTNYKQQIRKAVSTHETLSQEQKEMMLMADVGTDISVKVQYIPENTLTQNDIKEIDFTFTVNPESDAKFPGGPQKLKQYLKENAIDKIQKGSFKNYDLAAIKFTINEAGEIINAHIFESAYQMFDDENINTLLLETIRRMPCWTPAQYADGTKVKQEFVFTVGNMENCITNLLAIRRDQ